MASIGTETVAQLCSRLVEEHFNEKPYEPFVLDNFAVPKDALLATMAKESTRIRRDPSTKEHVNVPSLLLHNLPGQDDILEQYKQSDVYAFIEETTDLCSGLYGTSGAGKTRAIYEYLSHNFGFYFVANTNNDPGSKDLGRLVTMFSQFNSYSTLESLTYVDESQSQEIENLAKKREQRSVNNYFKMDRCVSILIHVRTVIFEAIKKLNPGLTPFDWLVIQLYPKKTMKNDLFSFVFAKCYVHALERPEDMSALTNLSEKYDVNDNENGWPWSVMVVDEAQALANKLTDFFLCGKVAKQRTAFSAVLKGMVNALEIIGTETGYPLVAGTGMQIEHIKEASDSITAKRPHTLRENRRTIFQTFKPLDADGVKIYLNDFLSWNTEQHVGDGQTPDDCVLDHVAKWLRGRPRWAASFLELYLVHEYDKGYIGTRGSFSPEGGRLIQALDRFLLNYTTGMIDDVYKGDDNSGKRGSFEPPQGTAFSTFSLAKNKVRYEVMRELESAIFKFAVGGKAAYVNADVAGLIEVGVAALSHDKDHRGAVLDEPIMIQGGINYFSMEKLAKSNMTNQEEGGLGDAFEKIMLPAIQRKFPEILKSQLGDTVVSLDGYAVSCRSSYGVLAVQCKTPSETIQWIDEAANSTFEGQVVPFCYPDAAFGPDLIFMLRNTLYCCCVFAISQAKYRNDIKQLEALRTIAPFLLYHQSRGKENQQLSTLISSDDVLKKRWEEVRPKLVGVKRGCVRFMVQYPCDKTRSATPGVIEDDQVTVKKSDLPDKKVDETKRKQNVTTATEGRPKKLFKEAKVETSDDDPKQERKLGWLVTIDKNNA